VAEEELKVAGKDDWVELRDGEGTGAGWARGGEGRQWELWGTAMWPRTDEIGGAGGERG
jgi:hypothetical protein